MRHAHSRLIPVLALLGIVAACGSGLPAGSPPGSASPSLSPAAATASPAGSPRPTPASSPGALEVTSAAQAAAIVLASDERFSSIQPLQPDLIGQAAWYEATEAGDHYTVMVTAGSGDCFAGCIDRHTWNYRVERDGTVELVGEDGDEVELPIDAGTDDPVAVTVQLLAGPVCPVEQDPPDPNCADRPVVNADVVLRDPTGAEVARGETGEDGRVVFSVPGGAYYADPGPVDGVMGQAQPAAFSAVGGSAAMLTLTYDTGIR